MSFISPIAGLLAVGLIGVLAWLLRRVERGLRIWLISGALLLAAALGQPLLRTSRTARPVVMLDQSASTRTAAYRDPQWLRERLSNLLPDSTPSVVSFSNDAADHTSWSLPDAEAVLLFSDGQFEVPANAPPTWAILDPNLDKAQDAAIDQVRDASDGRAMVDVRNSGGPRELNVGEDHRTISPGGETITVDATIGSIARLTPGDAWPENDSLEIPPRAEASTRWWCGSNAPPGWQSVSLPANLTAYSAAGVIAVAADASVSRLQQEQLQRYVNDLGGGLILVDRRDLNELSPLSFDPPTAQRRWLILIDRSGSMAAPLGTSTRFQAGCDAAKHFLEQLPANDSVALGGFARDLNWWFDNGTVAEARSKSFPPIDSAPGGPTNLEPLLSSLIDAQAEPTCEIVLLTDSDAPVASVDALSAKLSTHRARVHMLSIDQQNASLATLARVSGGETLNADSSIELQRQADRVVANVSPPRPSTMVRFDGVALLPARSTARWTPAWLRESATPLAHAASGECLAAEWRRGAGRTIAIAFAVDAAEAEDLAARVARTPTDPRLTVRCDDGQHVTIDVRDPDHHGNGWNFAVSLDRDPPAAMPQTAPGRYEIEFGSSSRARVAIITLDSQAVARKVIAPRYPLEFNAIGLNRPNLQLLATRSGGAIIESDDHRPIPLPKIERFWPLAKTCVLAAAICWLLALWRRKL